jgi:hypothetical protein
MPGISSLPSASTAICSMIPATAPHRTLDPQVRFKVSIRIKRTH